MKITDKLSINPDLLRSAALDETDDVINDETVINTFIQLVFDNDDYIHLNDQKEGKGFAERTKAKIDAYFEAWENAVLKK